MSALPALSVAPNHAFDTGASSAQPGADWLAQAPAVAASHQVDGFALQGQSSRIENIGVGARQGRLMTGRSDSGKLVFWLDGPGKQSVLRGAGGQPVTNLPDARAAARKALADTRVRSAPVTGSPALEASGRSTVQGVKTVTGYDRVNRQMRLGELVTVGGATGQPAFWLRGTGTNYPLRAADGQPITNRRLAEARAHQLIGSGAATGLREVHLSSPGGAEFKAPANRTSPRLSIDLESPAINPKGGRVEARFGLLGTRFGGKGSALSSEAAISRASAMGLPVQVTNDNPNSPPENARLHTDDNPKGSPENARLHAWVELTNDRTGGSEYANFTRNLSPGEPDLNATTYKLPANASVAFVEGYDQASRDIGAAQVAQIARNFAEGKAATSTARSNAPISSPVRSTPVVPTGRLVRRTQLPVAPSPAKVRTPSPTPESIPRSRPAITGSTRSSPPTPLNLLDSQTKNSVTAALQDLPTTINGSPAWKGHCASYSGIVAKRIAGVDMQTSLQRGQFKAVAADNIEAQLAAFGPNRQGFVRVGNGSHQFNWVTNSKGLATFVDATTGRTGTKLSDITVGLPTSFVTGDIKVNAFDLPHKSPVKRQQD